MSIDRPESGEPLTSNSIETMHQTVLAKINNVKDDNLGRSSIGPQHLSKTPEENLPNNNTTFVVDYSAGTQSGTDLLTKMVTVYVSGGGSNKGLADVDATQLLSEVTNNWLMISTLAVNETLIPDTDKNYKLIIRFDSRIAEFVDASNNLDEADLHGMVWYAVFIERSDISKGTVVITTNMNHIVEESVVGSHLIDSNKFVKNTGGSQAETDRHGGVQQSVSNTCCVEINRKVVAGVLIQQKILNIKLYAAYTTCAATSYNFSPPHTLKPKLANTTLRYYILQQPTNPS